MKARFILLFTSLAVNIAGMVMHNLPLLAVSAIGFAAYYAIKSIKLTRDK